MSRMVLTIILLLILSEFFLTEKTFTATFDVMLSGRPTLDELCEHVDIGSSWYKFGVLLKLKTEDLDNIAVYKSGDMQSLKMFDFWLINNPKATRKDIIDTLKKPFIGMNDTAERYLMALKESELEK